MIDTSLSKYGVFIVDTLTPEQAAGLVKFIDTHIEVFDAEEKRGDGFNTNAKGITLGTLHSLGVMDALNWDTTLFESYKSNVKEINDFLPFPVVVDSDAGYNLRKFEAGKHTGYHIDNLDFDGRGVRCLTCVTFLNPHEHTGGELVFPLQGLEVKVKAGQTVFFPPYWTHPHKANPVEDGFRYTVNCWFRSDV